MMNSRERIIAALNYAQPDKIPLVYHSSPAGLLVHGQKLLDLFNRYPPDNPVTFDRLPQLRPGTVDTNGRYHEVRTDEWGTTWEWLIYGLYGHPRSFPLADLDAAVNYDFPPAPNIGRASFMADRATVEVQKKDYFVIRGGVSLFEKFCALRPMDELLVDLVSGDARIIKVLDRLVEYMAHVVDYELAAGADGIFFGDDWGTQNAPIVSPKLFRDVFKPRYKALMEPIKRAGCKVCFHSCGHLGSIYDDLLDLGMDVFWPQILRYDEEALARTCKEHGVTIYLHPDRQYLVPLGTPAEIDARIASYAERYHRLGGGCIFYIEIENDAPFENVVALIEAVDKYR